MGGKNTRELGSEGEELASKFLQKKGYEILGQNYFCRYGEIDLVVKKHNCLYFVEVKRRISSKYGQAIFSISENKKTKIRRAARYLLTTNGAWKQCVPFFSVLTIDEDSRNEKKRIKVEFIPDAFQ